jgi:hypothetical protein
MILTPNCPSKPYYTAPPQISQKTISTHRDLSLSLSKRSISHALSLPSVLPTQTTNSTQKTTTTTTTKSSSKF